MKGELDEKTIQVHKAMTNELGRRPSVAELAARLREPQGSAPGRQADVEGLRAATEAFLASVEREVVRMADAQALKIRASLADALHGLIDEMEKRVRQSLCVVCGKRTVTRANQLMCDSCEGAKRMTGRAKVQS